MMTALIAPGLRAWGRSGRPGLRYRNMTTGYSLTPTLKCCFGSPVSERTAQFSRSKTFKLKNRNFSKSSSTMSETNGGAQCRQNFHETCEAHINKQINLELYASYVYMSMAYYFDRDDVAFPGLHKFFKKSSDEEREHAEKLMKYQNKRGGRIVLQPIAKPTNDEWTSPLSAMSAALELEKTVNQTLLELHGVAGNQGDANLCDFLESEYLEEQVVAIKELAGYVTQLKRCGTGIGEYIFDKELNE